MQSQKKERVRIFALARELGMDSKDLLTMCQNAGLDVKNQLSTVEPEVRDQIVLLVKKGSSAPAAPTPPSPAPTPASAAPTQRVIRDLNARPRSTGRSAEPSRATPPETPVPVQATAPAAKPAAEKTAQTPAASTAPAAPKSPGKPASVGTPPVATPPPETAATGTPTKVVASSETIPTTPTTTPPKVSPATTSAPPAAHPAASSPEKSAIPAATTPSSVLSTPSATIKPAEPPATRPAEAPTPLTPPPEPAAAPEVPRPAEPTRPTATSSPPAPRPADTSRPFSPVPNLTNRPLRNLSGPQRPSTPGTRPSSQGTPPAPPAAPPQGGAATPTASPSTTGQRPPVRPTSPSSQGSTRPAGQPPTGRPSQGTGTPQSSGQPPRPQQPQPSKPAASQTGGARKLGDITPEILASLQGRGSGITVQDIEKKLREQQQPPDSTKSGRHGTAAPVGRSGMVPVSPSIDDLDDDDDDRRRGRRGSTLSAVPGRADRHKERSERQAKRKIALEEMRGGRSAVARLLDEDSPRHRKDRRPKVKPQGTVARSGKTPISLPITVRSLSEAIGRKAAELAFKLIGLGMPPTTNINSVVDAEMAEIVALDYGVELEIKRSEDVEQTMLDRHEEEDAPENLVPRAPVVTVMGHVDHGKTSLLDRIRETYGLRSDVVSTEAGGITQVLRAWRVEKDGKPITFLDTPGHEAFTKMRARGANVTDLAVIVVAANDGVMPTTEEAISHAKAAEVSIVVAINKVDLPDANIRKTEQQLYSLGLIPDTMGGDVPFVQTSAKTGKGIDELLEQISVVAELRELKANPNKAASGTCLEAYLSEKEGVQATLLVQNGTLRPGDVVLCGASYGTVRKMYDDLSRVIESAGPSVPVRILGLDEVPNAGDDFYVVADLTTARQIAEDRKDRLAQRSLQSRKPVTLENLSDSKITELKVILKAEARGSIEAIRNELEKLHHEEVRVRILHAGIGAINLSDVQLALTSPEDTIILGFNVVPDNDAKALADERGIQIREYDIIYKLTDDMRSALEGKLKPREEIIHLGRAVVRETFKISRVGTIAGCYVTQGTIERNAKVRVIRSGVVVYPPPDRTASLESLKRFKDDVREVSQGFECGLKIAGYDDVKVDDVIEAYRIEQVQRSL